jgi:hypothetical protein
MEARAAEAAPGQERTSTRQGGVASLARTPASFPRRPGPGPWPIQADPGFDPGSCLLQALGRDLCFVAATGLSRSVPPISTVTVHTSYTHPTWGLTVSNQLHRAGILLDRTELHWKSPTTPGHYHLGDSQVCKSAWKRGSRNQQHMHCYPIRLPCFSLIDSPVACIQPMPTFHPSRSCTG